MKENQFEFATVGSVYADGIALIFDGQNAESQKHYKCNTAVTFAPGDRVKVAYCSGTVIVEFPIGNPGGG